MSVTTAFNLGMLVGGGLVLLGYFLNEWLVSKERGHD